MMIDVNKLIYNTLTLIGVPVYFEDADFDAQPSEYIVFQPILGYETNYSDDAATTDYSFFRVNYYGIDKARREEAMSLINKSMKKADFILRNKNITIPREAHAKYYGMYSEFAFYASLEASE